MKTALSIAGSDCSGGAGIQADLKTFSAHGVFGMSAIVSIVAENTARVIAVEAVSPTMIARQIDAVFEDIPPDAVKVGMLGGRESMIAVAQKLREYRPQHVVIDPVMYAKNGCALMDPGAIDTLIEHILPLATLLTPNVPEAEHIVGFPIKSVEDMERAAKAICAMGPKAVLVKGGHMEGDALDVLFDGTSIHHFSVPRIHTKNTHGTGCTTSSAIAANLALGLPVDEAVRRAKAYVTGAIAHALNLGKGNGPTHHFYSLYEKGLAQ